MVYQNQENQAQTCPVSTNRREFTKIKGKKLFEEQSENKENSKPEEADFTTMEILTHLPEFLREEI